MSKCTILIIEDEKNIQTFMGKVLKQHDYRVLSADSGSQGLEMVRSQCPDLILLDLGLPDMNGNDIIREVRTWTSTPIIVISARTAENDKVRSLDLGADDYITKPFGTSELLARIRASLRHSNRLRTNDTLYVRLPSSTRSSPAWPRTPARSLHTRPSSPMYGDPTRTATIRSSA